MFPTHDLLLVSLQWSPHQMSAAEVARLVQGDDVPGVDPTSPIIHRLKEGLPDTYARMAFAEARRQGYVFVNRRQYDRAWLASQLEEVWRWWCAAAGHPQIILSTVGSSNGTRIRCDVSLTGQDWSFGAFAAIGTLLAPLVSYDEGNWLFTTDELQIDGIQMDEAIPIVRALVDLGAAGRFREGVYEEGPVPRPERTAFPSPMSPI